MIKWKNSKKKFYIYKQELKMGNMSSNLAPVQPMGTQSIPVPQPLTQAAANATGIPQNQLQGFLSMFGVGNNAPQTAGTPPIIVNDPANPTYNQTAGTINLLTKMQLTCNQIQMVLSQSN